MRTLNAATTLALVSFALTFGAASPRASAKSAIVIVVENNEKASEDLADAHPAVLEALAIPVERALRGMILPRLDAAARAAAATPRSPRATPRAPRAEKSPKAPPAKKTPGARKASKRADAALPAFLRELIDRNGSRILHDVLEPKIDSHGEAFYGKILELTAARYWDRVVVLSDEEGSFDRFSEELRRLDAAGYTIDVVLNIHGTSTTSVLGNSTGRGADRLFFTGRSVTREQVAALGADKPLNLNAVYAVSCWGSHFNEAWQAAGARAANGADELNYYVLLSPIAFLHAFGRGLDLEAAAKSAYEVERALLDREALDEALAPMYGEAGADRVQTAKSSRRVHTGPRVKAACVGVSDTEATTAAPAPEGF